ncbi:MAG: hypothetical protein LAO20_19840 [Acidobacteriia bacterium]|nr:hypothetical protein [Terriglobia bacterium]
MHDALFLVWIGLAAGLLLLFFFTAIVNFRERRSLPVELGELIPSFLPVNLDVLNDVSGPAPAATPFQGTPKELAELQRRRVQRCIDCLRRMTHNAALLQRLGYSQLNNGNQLIGSLAQEMIDAGVHVRLYTLLGLAVLYGWKALLIIAIPLLSTARITELQEMMSSSLVPAYELLKSKADNLAILKFSSLQDALTQSL